MDQSLRVWEDTLEHLRDRLDADTFERYIASIVPLSFDPNKRIMKLGVLNDFVALWLESNYKLIITESLMAVLDGEVEVELESGYAAQTPENKTKTLPEKDTDNREKPCRYRPDFTFDNFVVGNNNRVCVAASQGVCKNPGKGYNPLFIYGGVGLGKTHLLQAIANEVASRRKRVRIEYVSSEEFVNYYIEALCNKTLPSFRRRFRSLDLLLIDDVQFFEGKVGSCEEFFHTFNTLHNAHKQIVLASDRTPADISGLEKRLVSRFEWGLSAEILPPNLETRVAILKKKQEKQSIQFDDEILFLIASKIQSNIRNLEGALTKLVMNVSAFGYEMTKDRAVELLQDRFDTAASRVLTTEQIQRHVAEFYDIRLSDMTSKKRPRNIAFPRMVAMYLSRKLTNQSFPAIGDAFSRNHATIVHAVSTIEDRMAGDEKLAQTLALLSRQLEKS